MSFGDLIAEGLGTGDFTAAASTGGASILNVVMVLLWVILLVGGVWFALYWTSFKHTVLIREITGTRRFIVKDKARIRLDKGDNVEYWVLRSRKVRLVGPKPESIEITRKGRFFAEVYHNVESGKDAGYSWISDDTSKVGIQFINYPAEHRALLSARIRRAQERRGKNSFEMIMQIAAIGIPLVAMVLVFSFWGDLTKTTVEASERLDATMKDFTIKITNITCQQGLTANKQGFVSSVPLDAQVSGVGG